MTLISNDILISVASSAEEVEQYRNAWKSLQWHPNADIDFYLTINKSRPEIIRPHVFILKENGCVKAMLVGRIEEVRFDLHFGYKIIFKEKIRQLHLIHGGNAIALNSVHERRMFFEIMNYLKGGDVDAVFFDHINTDSELYKLARSVPGCFLRDSFPIITSRWQMELPDSIGTFLQKIGSKHRYWLKRLERVVYNDFPQRVQFAFHSSQADIDKLCVDVESVALKTYQRGIGAGFHDNSENRARLELEAKKGWLRAYLIYIDETPCAFWIGSLYNGVFHLSFTGYDPHYRKYELGTVLLMKMIGNLCQDRIRTIDFGFGEAFYKQRFGKKVWDESSLYIFAPTPKGLVLKAKRAAVVGVSQVSKRLVKKAGLEQRIKSLWRKKLLKKE